MVRQSVVNLLDPRILHDTGFLFEAAKQARAEKANLGKGSEQKKPRGRKRQS